MNTSDNKKTEAAVKNEEKATPVIPWAITRQDLKVCIASRGGMDRLPLEAQEEVREEYGDGLVVLDFIKARQMDEMGLLTFERSTWDKLPENIQETLKKAYGESDGLRIFADGFLTLIDTGNYPTSQRGNALVFCKLRGRDYVHTVKPSVGYHWKKLATDENGFSGGHWEKDEEDSWLKSEINRMTDDLWKMFLSIHVDDDKKDNGNKAAPPKDDNKLKRDARNEQLKKWRTTIGDRYDSFANYEFDKIALL